MATRQGLPCALATDHLRVSQVFIKLFYESSESCPEFSNTIIILTLNIELMNFGS